MALDYNLEVLGDERFQKLCQALLVLEHPDTQCLPVGQPDGGRDGLRLRPAGLPDGGFSVYQVKYVKNPSSREARDAVLAVIKSERQKVQKLIDRGATSYYLMTNVSGTSHLDAGSIDTLNRELSDALSIPSTCWWRDDIERRIDGSQSVKWSYPEMIRATDLLQALVAHTSDPEDRRRSDAVKSYMGYQARYDAQLKFKQIDLQRNIIDLFVDVPASLVAPSFAESDHRAHRRWIEELEGLGFSEGISPFESDPSEDSLSRAPGAMQLLVNERLAAKRRRIVVEGAPGQGKSTVTQYLCQVNRLSLLGRSGELSRVAKEHRAVAARVPFRVDLRDYASWLSGRDPFSDDVNARLPLGSSPVLESFLAAQVHRYTGSAFSVDDLTAFARAAKLLIVLDGFDEVADTNLRNRIVVEVSDATARIAELAIEAQVIVTSRPAAFVNSPGFPRDEWQYLQILPLSRRVIETYAQKWLEGRAADVRERRDVMLVLKEKLDQPHIRDLARNPMQLAILLALISVQGASLPDQRTALYDKYIDIFLNRESEKSRVVRDHRPLLVQIHRYLAWMLQGEAEDSGAGHISETRMKEVLRVFLESSGHPSELIDQLFTGIVERVVALVSRVQGTFEFEVQPLREYFAARYLYDTAPYAPAGIEKSGTLPDRFDAIARNFYWLNVARFYAGCYSSGELASLVEGLTELRSREQFRYITHASQLGFTLLSDHVFSQNPRLTERLARELVDSDAFRAILALQYERRVDGVLTQPDGPARTKLVEKCGDTLQSTSNFDVQSSVAQILAANANVEYLRELWLRLDTRQKSPARWLQLGMLLSVLEKLTAKQASEMVLETGVASLSFLLRLGRNDVVEHHPELWEAALSETLDLGNTQIASHPSRRVRHVKLAAIAYLGAFLNPYASRRWSREDNKVPLRRILDRGPYYSMDVDLDIEQLHLDDPENAPLADLVQDLESLLNETVGNLRQSIRRWSDVIEKGRTLWGTRWALCKMAVLATEINIDLQAGTYSILDETRTLCDRAASALGNVDNVEWWSNELASIVKGTHAIAKFAIFSLIRWASNATILAVIPEVNALLDGLPDEHWRCLLTSLEERPFTARRHGARALSKEDRALLPGTMSPRSVVILMTRVRPVDEFELYQRYLKDYVGNDLTVHRAAMRIITDRAKEKPRYWAEALPVVRYGYSVGAVYLPLNDRRGRVTIPSDVARAISREASLYPLRLVAAAESVLAAEAGAATIPVSKVAARDDWFQPV